MFGHSPASSDGDDTQTPAQGSRFTDPEVLQAPSPFADNHTFRSTNQMQEPARPLSLLSRSMPVDPQPRNSTVARPYDPNLSGGLLHPSTFRNYVVSYISFIIPFSEQACAVMA
jgi:hypothetical protein